MFCSLVLRPQASLLYCIKASFLRHASQPLSNLRPSSIAGMSSSTLPPVLVYSSYAKGPRGIKEHIRKTEVELFKRCKFIPFDESPLSDESVESFRKAEVILMDTDKLPALMDTVENLKWVQSTWAGLDSFINYVDPSQLPPKFALTRFAGVFGVHMAEYVMGVILSHERSFHYLWEAQKKKEWALQEYIAKYSYQLLKERTISVIGAGDIGTEIGRVCKAFRMRTMGLGRREVPKEQRSEVFDEFRTSKDLPYVLAEADFIVNVLPSTKQTVDLLSGDTLAHCKKKPVFINVGRGDVISEDSIIKAIKEGWLSHAILDVANPEPIPKESPLWTMPEVTITPHVSAQSHGPEVANLFLENYERYVKGESLKYQLDWEAKY